MSLLLRGRWRATLHWWRHFVQSPTKPHRIYRIYRMAGFDTLEIGCDCGAVFERKMTTTERDTSDAR